MIPYVEIIDKYTLKQFAIIEPNECWFELSYYEIGEFEVYCDATNSNLNALKKGNYVKIPNKRFVWFITSIQYEYKVGKPRKILAKGFNAKWLLYLRIIQTPLELPTSLASAVYKLVYSNLGAGAEAARKINGFNVEQSTENINIDDTQATRGNLLEFTNNLLKTYSCGSIVIYQNGALTYQMLKGRDLTNTVKFSQSLDNLLSSEYYSSDEDIGTYSLVVSTVEDVDYPKEFNKDESATGIDRGEILVSSNLSTKYTDDNGVEQETTPTSTLYQGWQVEEGKKELANHITIESVNGEIDLNNSQYEFDNDFFIGDIVKVKDEYFNYNFNTRILKYTMKQDATGYGELAEYGGLNND